MSTNKQPVAPASNFIKNIIDADLASGKHAARRWAGRPGSAAEHAAAPLDPARIRTRFPPEPNGYLHFGHAKSILLNFGLAKEYGGRCHLRFDDTNPEKEEREYVDSIIAAVRWLGCAWDEGDENNLYYASDYFDWMYAFALHLIDTGHAYVDSQSAEEMRLNRGTLTSPGKNSPWRERSVAENRDLFIRMKNGEFADGAHILRARIDMASPNLNLRDPAIYRIRHASHHNTGDKWCVYPMYTFAHPIEDALECITHSICTLEFEDQRPFYDWLLARLAEKTRLADGSEVGGLVQTPLPQQIEFARLNLTYVVLSKRKLIELVNKGCVDGWDDPRMPTLVGARRRGYTPEGFRLFVDRIGVAKADALIDYGVFEDCFREVLNDSAPRRVAVLDPLRLVITNYPAGQSEDCEAPNHPLKPELGKRHMPFSGELWIEAEDFMVEPVKGFHRLYPPRTGADGALVPGSMARLKYGYIVRCTGYEADASGKVQTVFCEYLPETRSGTPGADSVKVKGNLHWVSAASALSAEVRLYDRLFSTPQPGARRAPDPADAERSYLDDLNPQSLSVISARLEPALSSAQPEECFQFERHGYFTVDHALSRPGAPVFNRTVTLRDSWSGRGG